MDGRETNETKYCKRVYDIVPVEMAHAQIWDNITTDGKLIGREDVIGN